MSTNPTEAMLMTVLRGECETGKATQRSVAVIYAMLVAVRAQAGSTGVWVETHDIIRAAFGWDKGPEMVRKLDPIKKMAWDIYEASARVQHRASATP